MTGTPFIPRTIRVHLGSPKEAAENVYVDFPDYIKNVASSEIYPTWPEAALRANIYAQISFALNRYYTEWYPSQGYDFDITNATRFDQSYVPGREIYDSVSVIVDDIFNSYVVKEGKIEPYFTQYCNGTTTKCNGLSQWGTVELARQGLSAFDILTRYYGEDISLVRNAPVRTGQPSYPGAALRLGDANNDVQLKQIQLNRISTNYPGIPKIYPVDGRFGVGTEEAVKAFQKLFGLTVDGIIGSATWYRITYLFNAVKRLSELDSEGIAIEELPQAFEELLSLGDSGDNVRVLTYYLNVIAAYYDTIPRLAVSEQFDEKTENAVKAFQQTFGLVPDGIVGRLTWQKMDEIYESIYTTSQLIDGGVALFPGRVLQPGFQGQDVEIMQEYLAYISETYPAIPAPSITGIFGQETEQAVLAFQAAFGIPQTGVVGVVTWDAIASLYSHLRNGNVKQPGQYPGYPLKEEPT